MRKNVACTITYTAWDTDANAPKTGDVAQHTMRIIADGTAGAITATPVEVENGEYKIVVAADENTGVAMTLEGASSTTYIEIIPVKWTNEIGADMQYILGHQLEQTGTQVADNFQTYFDVASQTFTSGTALANFKATGFSTHSADNVYTAFGDGSNLTTCATATGFNIVVPPTVAQLNARTLVTAEYATLAGQSTIAGYTDTLEALGATIAGYTDTLETSATTIAGYTDSLESAVSTLQGTANSILTDTGTTLHQFVDEVENLLKNVSYGLAALKAALDTIPSIAAGGTSTIIECQVGGSPVDGVEVWMTTDEAGANVVHGTFVSNAFGLADFGAIDSGTYFVWRQLAGYNFENPEEITVS